MRTLQTIQVYARLAQGLWIGLASVRENAVHDDSLPYQGTIFIHHGDSVPNTYQRTYKKVGMVWNDGWGGPSNIVAEAIFKDSRELIGKAGTAAATHRMAYKGEFFANYDLGTLLDIMAAGLLDIRSGHNPHATQVRYYLDDEPRNSPGGIREFSFPR